MLHLVSKFAEYGQETSIHQLSIYKIWNHLVFVHLLSSFGGVISDIKCGLISEGLDSTYSALAYQQSGFWLCFQYLTCTIRAILISDNKILSDMKSLGVDQRFLPVFGLEVVLISVTCVCGRARRHSLASLWVSYKWFESNRTEHVARHQGKDFLKTIHFI